MPPKPAEATCSAQVGVSSMTTKTAGINLYVLWEEETGYFDDPATGNHTVLFKAVRDGGKTFGKTIEPYRGNSACSLGSQMSIGQDGKGKDNVYVTWFGPSKLLLKVSNDNGSSFGNPVDLGSPNFASYQLVADSNNGAYVIFSKKNESMNTSEITFRKSIDGGKSFNDAVVVGSSNESNVNYQNIGLAVSGQNVYVVWSEMYVNNSCGSPDQPSCPSMIKFVKSSDGGNTFNPQSVSYIKDDVSKNNSAPTTTEQENNGSESSLNRTCSSPQSENIAAAGQNVYLIWLDANCNHSLVHSEDNGKTFSKPMNLLDYVQLTPNSFLYSSPYILAFENDRIYIAFMIGNSTGDEMMLLKSSDGGNNFLPIRSAIPQGFGGRAYPIIEHLAMSNNGQLYFAGSPDTEGKTILFEAVDENQTANPTPFIIHSKGNTPFYGYYPQIAASNAGYVYVLWLGSTDARSDPDGPHLNIMVRVSTDNGKTFSDTSKIADVLSLPEFSSLTMLIAALSLSLIVASIRAKWVSNISNRKSLKRP